MDMLKESPLILKIYYMANLLLQILFLNSVHCHWNKEVCYFGMLSLKTNQIELVAVPKNMTHFLLTCRFTNHCTFKKFEKQVFSEYFTSCIMEALEVEPDLDVTSVEVNSLLSTLKPCHAKVMRELYDYLKTENRKR